MTTTTPRASRTLATPPAGVYPSGHAGFSRAWDGSAWTGPVLKTPDAPELRTRHPFWGAFRHPALWIAVVGIVVGFVCAVYGGAYENEVLVIASGLIGSGGPIIALLLIVHRRLGIGRLHVRSALVWGIVSGVFAVAAAYAIESLIAPHIPGLASLALAGPIEETLKLLIPFLLLVFGPRIFRDPRVGIWAAVVSGGVFGILEGAEWMFDTLHAFVPTHGFTALQVGDADVLTTFEARFWCELQHPIYTGGAAALIWLGAHHRGRAFTGIGVLGLVIAMALHSVNDAVIGGVLVELGGTLGGIASFYGAIVWLVLEYTLWFRPRTRQAVAPDLLTTVPRRWVPRLSPRARHEAQEPVSDADAVAAV